MKNLTIAILAFTACLATLEAATLSPVVTTKSGQVRGQLVSNPQNKQDVYEFLAIPFAAPPVGELRFRKPEPVKPWTNVLDAVKPPNMCMQLKPTAKSSVLSKVSMVDLGLPISEDCLYLNLWVPKSAIDSKPKKPLATMIRIHGGAWLRSSSMLPVYNGAFLAGHENIIVATIQFRLGSLGFIYFGTKDAPGNVGLWDQMEAMKWIKQNIASFGGNPKAITIAGEGTGAASVAHHLVSTYSRPFFSQAILESGAGIVGTARFNQETANTVSDMVFKVIATKHCDKSVLKNGTAVAKKIKCLRSVDAAAFPEADLDPLYKNYAFAMEPVIDGDFIRIDPNDMIFKGDFTKVPLLVGGNKDDGSIVLTFNPDAMALLPPISQPHASLDYLNATHYEKLLEMAYTTAAVVPSFKIDPVLFSAMKQEYWPNEDHSTPKGAGVLLAAVQAATDYALRCPPFDWAYLTAPVLKAAKQPVFVYIFNQRPSTAANPDWMGVTHGDQVPFIFGQPFQSFYPDMAALTADEKKLSKMMMEYWGNFVKRGNPNKRDENIQTDYTLTQWPQFNTTKCHQQVFKLSVDSTIHNKGPLTKCIREDGGERCAFWDYRAYLTYEGWKGDLPEVPRYYGDSDFE